MSRGERKGAHGSRIAAVAVVAAAMLMLFGALPAALLVTAAPAQASVDDFEIESFDVEYELGLDDDGRSTLRTTEHIVAAFPDFDQNRGLIRDLTRVYDGHETGVEVLSVTDETGAPRDYDTEPFGDFLSVTMAVPEGDYVHGRQHYVVEYVQHDVTRHFEDTGADEFYWDLNGTEWAQPFGTVSARLILEEGLAERLDGGASCYRGSLGSDERCRIARDGGRFSVEETDLGPRENVTIAVGFAPGTFAAAPETPIAFLQRVPLLLWGGIAAFAGTVASFAISLVGGRRSRTGRAIIAQYDPPVGVSVALASEMLRTRRKSMTASLLDLAVRRKLRLLHDEQNDRYGAEAVDGGGLASDENWLYSRIFGSSKTASAVERGTKVWFTPRSTLLGDASAALVSREKTEAKRQLLRRSVGGARIIPIVVLPIVGLLLLVGHALVTGSETLFIVTLAVGINVLIWLVIGMIVVLTKAQRLTPQGALLLDHLKGLREYIRLAEADRIRMLQGPDGAEVDEQRIVRVYERLLPYAVLFGFEQEWQGELARYYRESTPEWVAGQGSFAHALPITSFDRRVAASPTTRSSFSSSSGSGSGSGGSFSSFSGGSSGGGFSGGGGGGGGGRGI